MSDLIPPLYTQAILLPLLAFPSWILCIPPLFWHFQQSNIASGSLILWVMLINFSNSINPLIWPRDNLDQWWDGKVWCDIHVRIQIGAIVGTTASAAMIVRRLAKVMDTSNIKISTSRESKLKEKALEILWCWLYPLVLILVYFVVQPARYFIYGIIGCIAAIDPSWPSVVLDAMWAPITTLVATYYATLLSYRLYRYRREFVRLVAARNTTKSRFIRLFVICIIVIAVCLPYTIWLVVTLLRAFGESYSWSRVHNPKVFHAIVKVPMYGVVPVDKWGQVATGYVVFFVFGTGSDAYNTYKKMLLAMGLGRFFPSLYIMRESGASTPSSFINARTWTSSISSKAKGMFWSRTNSMAYTLGDTTRQNSIAKSSIQRKQSLVREQPFPSQNASQRSGSSFYNRVFGRQAHDTPALPLFVDYRSRSVNEMPDTSTRMRDLSPGATAHAWAVDKLSPGLESESKSVGVRVLHEVRLEHEQLEEQAKARKLNDTMA